MTNVNIPSYCTISLAAQVPKIYKSNVLLPSASTEIKCIIKFMKNSFCINVIQHERVIMESSLTNKWQCYIPCIKTKILYRQHLHVFKPILCKRAVVIIARWKYYGDEILEPKVPSSFEFPLNLNHLQSMHTIFQKCKEKTLGNGRKEKGDQNCHLMNKSPKFHIIGREWWERYANYSIWTVE